VSAIGPRIPHLPAALRLLGTGLVGICLSVMVVIVPASPASAAEGSCPNEARRLEQGDAALALPDCRAYELVSPPGIQPHFETFGTLQNAHMADAVPGSVLGVTASQDSADPGIAFFSTFAPAGNTTDGPFYLSSRGEGGWSTQNVVPSQSTTVKPACLPYMVGWSADLGRGVLADGESTGSAACAFDEPELVPGEPRGFQNLFLRDSSAGTYQLIDHAPVNGPPANAIFDAGSSDLGVIAFAEAAVLTPGAPPVTHPEPEGGGAAIQARDFYVWSSGVDRLLTVLPDGQPATGEIAEAVVGSSTRYEMPGYTHAVAPDGSRIEFTSGGDLYSRLNPGEPQSAFDGLGRCDEPAMACTVQIDESETSEPGGGGVFAAAGGEDGTAIYFTDTSPLTSDSTAAAGEPDLYEYDFQKPEGERLTDLTVDQTSGEHADVLGFVGTNESGSPGDYAYFVADGVLASNPNTSGAAAIPGAANLYLHHGGTNTFIATLLGDPTGEGGNDACDWENRCSTARVSANGRYLGFDSVEELTGSGNLGPCHREVVSEGGQRVEVAQVIHCQEVFLYDSSAGELSCASCGETGSSPVAPASIRVPKLMSVANLPFPVTPQRNVSDAGQVFFDTADPLTEAVRNQQPNVYLQSNVYEYEDGRVHLLSSGTSDAPSYFYEASADGKDAYLIGAQALTPGASGAEYSVYDAKVDGGFPGSPPATGCQGESCRGATTQPAAASSPATSGFSGPSEGPDHAQKPVCRKGRVKKAGKCVKKQAKKKRHRSDGSRHAGDRSRRRGRDNRRNRR
jgi:hypothetical protein